MFRRPEDQASGSGSGAKEKRRKVVVAGPGSSLTIPGIIVSEIVGSLAQWASVSRIQVDLDTELMVGLHRAPSLAAAHDALWSANIEQHQAPLSARLRTQAFKNWIGPDVGTAVAYAWPGISNAWIKQFIEIANAAGAMTIVACASLPKTSRANAVMMADIFYQADLVLVGDPADAAALTLEYGTSGPEVDSHRALCLGGRSGNSSVQQITAFLPKDGSESLSTVLAAFDAFPEAGVEAFGLQVVMRYSGPIMPELVASSYHAGHVQLIGDDISTLDLEKLCSTSSILSVVEPTFDSRVFSMAVDVGIATVVLANSHLPEVGRGYVGGLLADRHRPASVHVALTHALRLEELGFPSPDVWDELAQRLNPAPHLEVRSFVPSEPATRI
jgi:hypothetical protein